MSNLRALETLLLLLTSCTADLPAPPEPLRGEGDGEVGEDSAEEGEPGQPDVEIDLEGLGECSADTSSYFLIQYAGPAPDLPSVPLLLADGVGSFEEVMGVCVRQRFEDGGERTRCLDLPDLSGPPSLYLQGLPAPEQTAELELGMVLEDGILCWSERPRQISLGQPSVIPLRYEVADQALSTPDYPPLALASLMGRKNVYLYMVSLMDSPRFGVSAGDVLWSYDASSFDGAIFEVQPLDNGLLAFATSSEEETADYEVFDPAYPGTSAVTIDRAGLIWSRQEGCDPTGAGSPCLGFLHHGSAAIADHNAMVVNGYEALTDASGSPLLSEYDGQQYQMISTLFKGFVMEAGAEPDPLFELSFQDLFDLDPGRVSTLGSGLYTGPDGEHYQSVYYLNSSDIRAEGSDPEQYHLSGTITAAPFTGAFDITMDGEGQVLDTQLYQREDPDQTWLTDDGESPLGPTLHSAELIDRDESTSNLHFAVYDRSTSASEDRYSDCAGFYHLEIQGDEIAVGGPYRTAVYVPGLGDLCGNSWGYGNAAVELSARLEGSDEPVALVAVFDNLASPVDEADISGDLEDIYYPGSPRLTGLFTNPDPSDPEGWVLASTLYAENPEELNPSGFTRILSPDLVVMISDTPFSLKGLP